MSGRGRGGRGRGRRRDDGNGFAGQGGYMAAKKSKLEGQFAADVQNDNNSNQQDGIFKGVAIFVNGYVAFNFELLVN
jgi:DNA repair protein REV1